MAGGVFFWEGLLKFVYVNQGVGRFTKLGIPFPHFTAAFIGYLEIFGGLLLLTGLTTRLIAIPFIAEMIVAVFSTKLSLYLGTSPLPLPPAPPWVCRLPLSAESSMPLAIAARRKNEPRQRYTVEAVADRSGEFGSFEELAMPLFAKLYNFAHWLTQDRAAAEDLVQETYMKALRGFSSFRQGTNFRAWMYKILRNTFLTTQTGLKAWASVSLDSDSDGDAPIEPAVSESPESVLLARVQQETIQNALEKLPVKFREIVLLCDLEEMSYQEIGEMLGIPLGTVMSRLSRARKAMRVLLTANCRRVRDDV
jgi:RNA polymerase sigma-70 factor (ECF subfamily)